MVEKSFTDAFGTITFTDKFGVSLTLINGSVQEPKICKECIRAFITVRPSGGKHDTGNSVFFLHMLLLGVMKSVPHPVHGDVQISKRGKKTGHEHLISRNGIIHHLCSICWKTANNLRFLSSEELRTLIDPSKAVDYARLRTRFNAFLNDFTDSCKIAVCESCYNNLVELLSADVNSIGDFEADVEKCPYPNSITFIYHHNADDVYMNGDDVYMVGKCARRKIINQNVFCRGDDGESSPCPCGIHHPIIAKHNVLSAMKASDNLKKFRFIDIDSLDESDNLPQ